MNFSIIHAWSDYNQYKLFKNACGTQALVVGQLETVEIETGNGKLKLKNYLSATTHIARWQNIQ